jgi:ribosome recycling factor
VPEPRILLVNPFDKGSVEQIERAIRESDLGLNPATDGASHPVRVPGADRRAAARIHQAREVRRRGGKVAVRNIRRSARDAMQKLEDDGEVGTDERERYTKQLEELTRRHVAKIDEALEHKEHELLEV